MEKEALIPPTSKRCFHYRKRDFFLVSLCFCFLLLSVGAVLGYFFYPSSSTKIITCGTSVSKIDTYFKEFDGTVTSISRNPSAMSSNTGKVAVTTAYGSLYVFDSSMAVITEDEVDDFDIEFDVFGVGSTLSSDETMLVVSGSIGKIGRLWLFTSYGTSWSFRTYISYSVFQTPSGFGRSMTFLRDNTILAVSCPSCYVSQTSRGSIRLYDITSSGFEPRTEISSPNRSNFGDFIAIHGDYALVSTLTGSSQDVYKGCVQIFDISDVDDWKLVFDFVFSDSTSPSFFYPKALDFDTPTFLFVDKKWVSKITQTSDKWNNWSVISFFKFPEIQSLVRPISTCFYNGEYNVYGVYSLVDQTTRRSMFYWQASVITGPYNPVETTTTPSDLIEYNSGQIIDFSATKYGLFFVYGKNLKVFYYE